MLGECGQVERNGVAVLRPARNRADQFGAMEGALQAGEAADAAFQSGSTVEGEPGGIANFQPLVHRAADRQSDEHLGAVDQFEDRIPRLNSFAIVGEDSPELAVDGGDQVEPCISPHTPPGGFQLPVEGGDPAEEAPLFRVESREALLNLENLGGGATEIGPSRVEVEARGDGLALGLDPGDLGLPLGQLLAGGLLLGLGRFQSEACFGTVGSEIFGALPLGHPELEKGGRLGFLRNADILPFPEVLCLQRKETGLPLEEEFPLPLQVCPLPEEFLMVGLEKLATGLQLVEVPVVRGGIEGDPENLIPGDSLVYRPVFRLENPLDRSAHGHLAGVENCGFAPLCKVFPEEKEGGEGDEQEPEKEASDFQGSG